MDISITVCGQRHSYVQATWFKLKKKKTRYFLHSFNFSSDFLKFTERP